jgi:hypothetical protein
MHGHGTLLLNLQCFTINVAGSMPMPDSFCDHFKDLKQDEIMIIVSFTLW